MIWKHLIHLMIYFRFITGLLDDVGYSTYLDNYKYFIGPCLKGYDLKHADIRIFKDIAEYQKSASYNSSLIKKRRMHPLIKHDVIIQGPLDLVPRHGFSSGEQTFVMQLSLSHSGLREIRGWAFSDLQCLHFLNLRQNNIVDLYPSQWYGLETLVSLNLIYNRITHLNTMTFKYLKNLRELRLSYNHIMEIEDYSFLGLAKLEALHLDHNSLKSIDHSHSFEGLFNLLHLDFSYADISKVPLVAFISTNFTLETLNLSGNALTTLPFYMKGSDRPDNFTFSSLLLLNLTDNFLHEIDYLNFTVHFKSKQFTVDLNRNAFDCTYLQKVLQYFKNKSISVSQGRYLGALHHRESIRCHNIQETGTSDTDQVRAMRQFRIPFDFENEQSSTTKPPKAYLSLDEKVNLVLDEHTKDNIRVMVIIAEVIFLIECIIILDCVCGYQIRRFCRVISRERPPPVLDLD
ncbi:leucine-rich repeat transmembrane neuronal protein 2-like isoform X2 [Sitophilus oryzae]|uniref:Leucine-rich repeat transmembrane neuronal protein 2-like isoform X2 n=1 Tax=Sitophilus oryzae TaxID=7048 RepID=A0A6J2XFV1_SITOR|nr:leucine-rich repeat transmembrane neuronal protein 2-like isoform X2 [Sitophilus oryzae]XP_030750031.1 leucine-rich repeat transmembrane neuronal protein 2-like isoform X2 [Sitophilus oryzae]